MAARYRKQGKRQSISPTWGVHSLRGCTWLSIEVDFVDAMQLGPIGPVWWPDRENLRWSQNLSPNGCCFFVAYTPAAIASAFDVHLATSQQSAPLLLARMAARAITFFVPAAFGHFRSLKSFSNPSALPPLSPTSFSSLLSPLALPLPLSPFLPFSLMQAQC